MTNSSDNAALAVHETISVRKFTDEWTEAQIASGEAEPFEIVTMTDGVITGIWKRDV